MRSVLSVCREFHPFLVAEVDAEVMSLTMELGYEPYFCLTYSSGYVHGDLPFLKTCRYTHLPERVHRRLARFSFLRLRSAILHFLFHSSRCWGESRKKLPQLGHAPEVVGLTHLLHLYLQYALDSGPLSYAFGQPLAILISRFVVIGAEYSLHPSALHTSHLGRHHCSPAFSMTAL